MKIKLLLVYLCTVSIISLSGDFTLYIKNYDPQTSRVDVAVVCNFISVEDPRVTLFSGVFRREILPKKLGLGSYYFSFYAGSLPKLAKLTAIIRGKDFMQNTRSSSFPDFINLSDFRPSPEINLWAARNNAGEYEYDYSVTTDAGLVLSSISTPESTFTQAIELVQSMENLPDGTYNTVFRFLNYYGMEFSFDVKLMKISDLILSENSIKTEFDEEFIGYYVVSSNDTVSKIATLYSLHPGEIVIANNIKDHSKIFPGQVLKISKILFKDSPLSIKIDISKNKMYLYYHDRLIKNFTVAVGTSDSTPPGEYRIMYREKEPALYWYGEYIRPGSIINGIGSRWLQLSFPQYGIHGTNKPWEIGKRISHGCIRMFNFDVEQIDFIVSLGTQVTVYKSEGE